MIDCLCAHPRASHEDYGRPSPQENPLARWGGCTYLECGCTRYRQLRFLRPIVKQHRYTQWTEHVAQVNGRTVAWIQAFGGRVFTIYLKQPDGSDATLCSTSPLYKARLVLAQHLRTADISHHLKEAGTP